MLTAKGKYGLKAVLHLAALQSGATAHAADIAKANNISKKFLDAILAELRTAGIVIAKRGPGGGYRLARSPRAIKVGLVVRTLDGPLAPIACASRSGYKPCRDCDVATCKVRKTMAKVRDATAKILDGLSIADMSGGRRAGSRPRAQLS
jgi:Rrf2 family protein